MSEGIKIDILSTIDTPADLRKLSVYLTAYEYGKFVSEKEEQEEYIKEHCECVIAENAIGKLKK